MRRLLLASCGLLMTVGVAHATLIDLNDFYADPAALVSSDGSSAVLMESQSFAFSSLSNDPLLGDPEVIVATPGSTLLFDYLFRESEFGNDEFGVWIIDPATGSSIGGSLESFIRDSGCGTLAFDLSPLAGMTGLGLQFQLSSLPGDDDVYASVLAVSNVRINLNQVPEPATLTLLGIGAALLLVRVRRKAR